MSKIIYTFKRKEIKYKINKEQKEQLIKSIENYLIPDSYGLSTIHSLYLDTNDYLLIRNSMEGKVYKEKLRIRSYKTPSIDSNVFLEIKKKYKGIVYKRREKMTYLQAMNYIEHHIQPFQSQIMNEIDYAFNYYHHPKPSFMIAYEREAYFVKEHPDLRLTFDSNIRYRTTKVSLLNGHDGKRILPEDEYVLEIKSANAMPLWLVNAINALEIRPQSYSKYKNSYIDYINQKEEL